MKVRNTFLLICIISLLSISCKRNNVPTGVISTPGEEQEKEKYDPFIEGNRNILRMEDEDIRLFIKRYGWQMKRMDSGLYLEVLKEGSGRCFKEGDEVRLDYQTMLLDGDVVYTSSQDGIKRFKVDKSEEIPGLHEAVKHLRPGAKARLVVPSYLAYGVAGDGNRINGRKSLAITIEILN